MNASRLGTSKAAQVIAQAREPGSQVLYMAPDYVRARNFWEYELLPALRAQVVAPWTWNSLRMRVQIEGGGSIWIGHAEGDYRGLRLTGIDHDQAVNVPEHLLASLKGPAK